MGGMLVTALICSLLQGYLLHGLPSCTAFMHLSCQAVYRLRRAEGSRVVQL